MMMTKRAHYSLIAGLLAVIFAFQLFAAHKKQYSSFSMDYANYATLGRQMSEFGSLPTFLFPGKTYDGPVKPAATYFPVLLFGHHEVIPVIMSALYGTLLCLGCYVLGAMLFSRRVGIIALLLSAASDPSITITVFCYEHAFDVMFLLGMMIGACSIRWAKLYRESKCQPTAVLCVLMGLSAGLLWYTHPLGSANIMAAALFLFLAIGFNIFTWRVPVVAASAIVGSLPLWLFVVRHPDAYRSWQGFAEKYQRSKGVMEFLFASDGYLATMLAPSGNGLMLFFLGSSVAAASLFLIVGAWRWWRGSERKSILECLKSGFPVNAALYGVLLTVIISSLLFKMDEMVRVAGGDYKYGMELWFWFLLAGAWALDAVIVRFRRFGCILAIALIGFFASSTIRSVSALDRRLVSHWNAVKADAEALLENGHNNMIAQGWEYYMYFAIGPSGLYVSHMDSPWVEKMGCLNEEAESPCMAVKLNPANLGYGKWMTEKLRTISVHHSFDMPDGGVLLDAGKWSIRSEGISAESLERLRDDRGDTSWVQSGGESVVFDIELDKPRHISRFCMFIHNDDRYGTGYTFPRKLKVSGRLPSGEWTILTHGAHYDGFFWDGGRLFRDEFDKHKISSRFDVRFAGQEVTALKIEDNDPDNSKMRKITELYLFEKSDGDERQESIQEIVERLHETGCERVIGDRYISAQLGRCGFDVWKPAILEEPDYAPEFKKDWPWFRYLQPIGGGQGTALVIDEAFSERIRKIFEEDKINYSSSVAGGYVIYTLASDQPLSELVWNGMTVMRYFNKDASGYTALRVSDTLTELSVRFSDVAELIDVDFSKGSIRPGSQVLIKYYWRIPDRWKYVYRRPMVFSHLVRNDNMLVDDHPLLTDYGHIYLREVLPDEIFIEERVLNIPKETPPGSYQLELGLHFQGERVPVNANGKDLRVRKRAVWLPGIEITKEENAD